MKLWLDTANVAKAGAHIATMPYAVFQGMFKHPLRDAGIERFLEDARQTGRVSA